MQIAISSTWKSLCFQATFLLLLNLPDEIYGRSILKIYDNEDTKTVTLPDGSANVVFFSIQGSAGGSCTGAELYCFLNQQLSDMLQIKLSSLGSGESHVFNMTLGGKNQIATISSSQFIEYSYLSILCQSHTNLRLYLENGRLSLGLNVVKDPLWESEYFEGMNTIHSVRVEKNTPADPLYSMVAPFALPLVSAFNITNNWENHELYQLFDLDYSIETCIEAYPQPERSWILKIRIPLLTGYYHGNHTSVIITGDFMECDDPIKTMVSTVNNEKGLPDAGWHADYCEANPGLQVTLCMYDSSTEEGNMKTCRYSCKSDPAMGEFNELYILLQGEYKEILNLCEINYE